MAICWLAESRSSSSSSASLAESQPMTSTYLERLSRSLDTAAPTSG